MRSRIVWLGALIAALTLLASGCSGLPFGSKPAPPPVTVTASPSAGTTTGTLSGSNIFDLLDVSRTAPECPEVWVAGARLPSNYEWCYDETDGAHVPLAGVRSGPCEVVTFRNRLYAVPGFRIHENSNPDEVGGISSLGRDPGYQRLLTSCLRTPCPDAPADSNRERIPYPQCDPERRQ